MVKFFFIRVLSFRQSFYLSEVRKNYQDSIKNKKWSLGTYYTVRYDDREMLQNEGN